MTRTAVTTSRRRPGEVLVKVAAASVNPIDFKTRGAQGGVPRWAVTLPKVS
jgi:NADPH:quinone reductase-like Zn-dependent oxidoreductase